MSEVGLSKQILQVVVVVLVGLSALWGAGSGAVHTVQAQDVGYSIAVTGIGTAAIAPDLATVDLGVEVVNASLSQGLDTANATMTDIGRILTTFKVAPADIQTNLFSVIPIDRVDARGPTGAFLYRIRITQRVVIRDVSTVTDVLNGAIRAGANVVNNFAYAVNDLRAAETTARAAAIADAQKRAGELAEALNIRLGDPIIVTEQVTSFTLPPILPGLNNRGAVLEGEPPANVGQLIVRAQIEVTYTIRL